MRKILIVDDVYANRYLVKMLFPRDIVVGAENGEQMWEKLSGSPPDLILMDVNLPGEDGFELTRKLKTMDNYREIPVVFLTVHSERAAVMKAVELGGEGYVTKPFDEDLLVERVNRVLEKKRLKDLKAEE